MMSRYTAQLYTRQVNRQIWIVVSLLLLLLVGAYIGLFSGPVKLSLHEILTNSQSMAGRIFLSIRLPRVLAAILAGAGLSISGMTMQNVLRNPLASPFTLGLSGAAAFGAALSIVTVGSVKGIDNVLAAVPFLGQLITGISAFVFCLLSVFIIIWIMKQRGSRPSIIVLAGIMLSSLFNACTSALQYFVNDRQLAEIIFWTFGDPGRGNYLMLAVQACIIIPALIWMVAHTWDFALLQSGDDSARASGLDPARFRYRVLVLTSLMTAVIVAGYGIIGFVGLVAPHVCRFFVKGNWMTVIASSLFGALFLLSSDVLARLILEPVILPVGIVTAFFGAPFFIIMLLQNKGFK